MRSGRPSLSPSEVYLCVYGGRCCGFVGGAAAGGGAPPPVPMESRSESESVRLEDAHTAMLAAAQAKLEAYFHSIGIPLASGIPISKILVENDVGLDG